MKNRGRVSRVTAPDSNRMRNKNGNFNHNIQTRYSGPSFSDLPKDIMLDIFLRLFNIKSIPFCKSVCKPWRDVISDPEFPKLHFDETCDQVYPLIHTSGSNSRSETLYLVQPNKDALNIKLQMCNHTKFELPSPIDGEIFWDSELACSYTISQNRYNIVNSCNGLLCLSHGIERNSVIICNPVTREFTVLPKAEEIDSRDIQYGFGFSHVANQYKVVRIVNATIEIHTVGSESWREIRRKSNHFIYGCPTYLKGFLYWSYSFKTRSLISFDIENECFGFVLGPELEANQRYTSFDIGVLGGELCMSFVMEFGNIQVWVLKECGAQKTWSNVFSSKRMLSGGRQISHESLKPIKYLDDGSLLMFYSNSNSLIQVDRKKRGFRRLKISGMDSKVKALVAHTPSLMPLKQSLSGVNVKVFKLMSRFGELKLHEQVDDVHLVEKEF